MYRIILIWLQMIIAKIEGTRSKLEQAVPDFPENKPWVTIWELGYFLQEYEDSE